MAVFKAIRYSDIEKHILGILMLFMSAH